MACARAASTGAGALVRRARVWLTSKVPEFPALQGYLSRFEEWDPMTL